jgi:CheY-like chemotaxis protein
MLVARGGDEHAIGATAAPIVKPDGSVAGVALVLHDDEEVRRADEATELLGGLAASLAHEVNNPLSSVVGSLEFLAHALEAGDLVALPEHDAEVGDAVRTARAGADRIRRLVREMKGGQTFEASLAPSASSRVRRGTTAAPDAGASTDVDGLAIYASRPITGTVLRTTRVRAGSGAGRGSSPGPKDEAPSAATGAPGDAPATGASRSRVLIVDDDPLVGTSLRRVLSRDHDVIVDVSAKDALSRLRDGERFDVVLCDLMMPDMTGMDLHAELARIAPQMAGRMVFLTGGAYTAHAREFLAAVPNPRLQKPFDAQLLRAVVRDVVAGARHDAKEGA